jgi:hypothetical protein
VVACQAFLELVLLDTTLRNRNPLHPSVLDALVIGNLLNFPKVPTPSVLVIPVLLLLAAAIQ